MKLGHFILAVLILWSCNEDGEPIPTPENPIEAYSAEVIKVSVNGTATNYNFNVTVKSPDTGCEQYADWWEVITADQKLVYRRILAHSHVNEQPFSRSGGPVAVVANQDLVIRAHMNNLGYGNVVMVGNVENGFTIDTLDRELEFAKQLEEEAPQPTGCAF